MTEETATVDRGLGEKLNSPHFNYVTKVITGELEQVCKGVDAAAWARAGTVLLGAPAVFTVGTGRSGLALRMAAMRFMHLGLSTYVVGETTTPAIGAGELLVAASGSGTTSRVVRAAEVARKQGANVLALTTAAESPLAKTATEVLVIPAADKQDFEGKTSEQYAGSLFEQSVLVLADALFGMLWRSSGVQARELWRLHANLE